MAGRRVGTGAKSKEKEGKPLKREKRGSSIKLHGFTLPTFDPGSKGLLYGSAR